MRNAFLFSIGFIVWSSVSTVASAAEVSLKVNNLKPGQGKVYASLCTQDAFMRKRCGFEIVRKVEQNSERLVFNDLSEGRYAISVFYDENDNEKLDSSIFGIPREPTGVSNNAVSKKGPPKFKDAAFTLDAEDSLKMMIDVY